MAVDTLCIALTDLTTSKIKLLSFAGLPISIKQRVSVFALLKESISAMSTTELSSFKTDENGEKYFVDINGRHVYYKRAAGYHNIGGKRLSNTEHSIARLGEPNPNLVIPIDEAKERLAMTDELSQALKNRKKGG